VGGHCSGSPAQKRHVDEKRAASLGSATTPAGLRGGQGPRWRRLVLGVPWVLLSRFVFNSFSVLLVLLLFFIVAFSYLAAGLL
jgi:hypothetical protein